MATQAQMNALKIGDTIRMVVVGNSPTITGGKFIVKINGSDVSAGGFQVTTNLTPIRTDRVREFYYDYPISRAGAYAIGGYVISVAPTATATLFPTAVPGTGVCPSGYSCAPSSSGFSCAQGYHSDSTTTPPGACGTFQECFTCLADVVDIGGGSDVAGASSDRSPLDMLKGALLNTYKGIFKSLN
ncbi:hypothetical protein A3A84_02805 [Candidatus Collierbacteria bacterium RIFCSPLOWO2_01_FULL_50_23]|uniref:Uncharacterized protein n=2 Tax=Candidatus Collieribacteriota TaxID=1752725 RepID=A0A1F5EY23_9BACT|nr:MAG: hypothetical protein A2703_01200 [Candidatus Collierbacteria bacterium RIFCSPHIGHO2_01_FULL_50_25]OGD72311.1 MAG: hypothetical protein A3D09_01885 [Candidatus Collierbacteria bacterium RIFCSPHIGHO2_02_FULL_49_10]OGD74996.1 MAG: hypothetical protein A3A84_02805 [Candidatus Collierbacteria bacterium RIFCSPLOWO2_01_FULL_50_23]